MSGSFEVAARTGDALVLRRRADASTPRSGNVSEVELYRAAIDEGLAEYERGETDLVLVRYTPRLADLMPRAAQPDAVLGPASWSAYIRFDHSHPAAGNLDLRKALAHAIDRDALAAVCPPNLVVATGGVVPPALQGHTPDIVQRYDPDLARDHLERSGFQGDLELAGMMVWGEILAILTDGWRDVFGGRVKRPLVVMAGRGSDRDRRTDRRGAVPDHRLAAGLRRPGVLPAPALPVDEPDE